MAKKKPRYGDVVLVKWWDSCGPHRKWQTREYAEEYEAAPCLSLGFFVKKDRKVLVIASDVAPEELGNVFAIPAGCIKSIRVLSRAKAK